MTLLSWVDRNRGRATFLASVSAGVFAVGLWLVKGGAVPLYTSLTALAQPEVAEALANLPQHHNRVEAQLSEVQAVLVQITDTLASYSAENQDVIEWVPDHSQRLTDAVGGCVAGPGCEVYFRGRRTQAGVGCVLSTAKPRLLLDDGREFPVPFDEPFDLDSIGTRFETIRAVFTIPDFIEPGLTGFVVVNIYAECPFAAEGTLIQRETFRLIIEVRADDTF